MLLLIDNYDSFTYNLVHFLGELGAESIVRRNDAIKVEEALAMRPAGVILSPGPCDPDRAGICVPLVDALARSAVPVPVLGVCLGHQTIGQVFGGKVVRAPEPMHGKTSPIRHDSSGVFAGLGDGFSATRYHSLMVAREELPACLSVNAWSDDGVIMGLRHERLPMHGVQFHPESIATVFGHDLLRNFLDIIRQNGHAA
ncbi:MAG: anthranilate synthase component II [Alphaproteobacteria bacterium]